MRDISKSKMFLKRVRYYIYNPKELELTIRVVNQAYRQAFELLADLDRFENESPAYTRE